MWYFVAMRRNWALVLSLSGALSGLVGCGQAVTETSPAEGPAPTSEPAPAPSTPNRGEVAAEEAPTPPAPTPAEVLPELELLHAVPSRVSVSSAYRDDPAQVARLVDGDLETAWNSRTGDLVGAWIELELPLHVTVRAIAITPGYTHVTPRADLFPGNHRISRVRIHREGAVLAEHDLDVERREPVELPVNAGGGRYRVEVLATVPGTHDDWQETCVSELRVLGTAAQGRAGASTPVTSVGALTGSLEDAELATEAAEDAELDAELEAMTIEQYGDLLEDWIGYVAGLSPELDQDDFDASPTARDNIERLARERREILHGAAEIFEERDAARGQALERRAAGPDGLWAGRVTDLEALLDGYEALLGPTRRCEVATRRADVSAQTLRSLLDTYSMLLDVDLEGGYGPDGRRLSGARRIELRDARTAAQAFLGRLQSAGVREDAESLPARGRTALLESTDPGPAALASDWASTRRELERARDCP